MYKDSSDESSSSKDESMDDRQLAVLDPLSVERSNTGESDNKSVSMLMGNMKELISHVLTGPQMSAVSTNPTQLIAFDPEDPDADIDGWCNVTEFIIQNKRLEGVDLLMALSNALKGRAATCLTKINVKDLSWDVIKQTLLATFSKPFNLRIKECFDKILDFKIGQETAVESGLRLWSLIDGIPRTEMPEEVITGFVISVLCLKDSRIRHELNIHTITTRTDLLRVLSNVPLKRHLDVTQTQEPELKRKRYQVICNKCGGQGHKSAQCKKPKDGIPEQTNQNTSVLVDEKYKTCHYCGKRGHIKPHCYLKMQRDQDKITKDGIPKQTNKKKNATLKEEKIKCNFCRKPGHTVRRCYAMQAITNAKQENNTTILAGAMDKDVNQSGNTMVGKSQSTETPSNKKVSFTINGPLLKKASSDIAGSMDDTHVKQSVWSQFKL